ncbi:MAG: DUF1611 domain-containing protein [Egibacteraceae bacterium]
MPAFLSPKRLSRVKTTYTTRHVRPESFAALLGGQRRPRAGDLVLARVTAIGQHPRIERADGRRAMLFEGDEILLCYGNRYAPDQFEALVPDDLGPCHLVAAGGVAGRVVAWHLDMDEPTEIVPLGLVGTPEGTPLNLRDWGLPEPVGQVNGRRPWTVAVVGTAMNAGKTTTAAGIVRGLVRAGYSAGAAKITGTGAGGDVWLMADAGAQPVLDFTHAGFASTYRCDPEDVETILRTLYGQLVDAGVDVAVLEVADGVFQNETAVLLASAAFRALVDKVVFAACDALGAAAGVSLLRRLELPVAAASGLLGASPLAVREARAHLDVPVLTFEELCGIGGCDAAVRLFRETLAGRPLARLG